MARIKLDPPSRDQLTEVAESIRDYLSTFSKLKALPCLKNSQTLCTRQFKHARKTQEHAKLQQAVALAPVGSAYFDLWPALETSQSPVHLNVVETLVGSHMHKTYFYSKEGRVKILRGGRAVARFLRVCAKVQVKSAYTYPLCVFHDWHGTELVFNPAVASDKANSARIFIMQKFVVPKGNTVSKLRVHWEAGSIVDIFHISNSIRIPRTAGVPPLMEPTKESTDILALLRRTNAATKKLKLDCRSNESDLSPLIRFSRSTAVEFPGFEDNDDFNEDNSNASFFHSTDLQGIDTRPYLLHTSQSDAWIVEKVTILPQPVQYMQHQLLRLMKQSGKPQIKAFTADFIKDSAGQWHVYKVPQFQERVIRGRSRLFKRLPIETLATTSLNHSELFRNNKRKHSGTSFCSLSHFRGGLAGLINRHLDLTQPVSEDADLSNKKDRLLHTSFTLERRAECNKKIVCESLQKFETLQIRARKKRLESKDFAQKYGGQQFVKNFVVELYNKIMQHPLLVDLFCGLNQEKLNHIVCKFTCLFRFKHNREFRKQFRLAHENRGIEEQHIIAYLDLLAQTLTKFEVSQLDQDILIDEIQSLFACAKKRELN